MRFDFGKSRFNGIEVWTVRWQVAKRDAPGSEQGFDALNFVRGQIVQNERVPGLQAGNEDLLQIDQEDLGIHGPIHQKWGGDLFLTQRRQKGGTLPMAVRYRAQATFAAGTATVQAGQLGVEAGFINKDQPRCIPGRLLALPQSACPFNVRPVLLGGARRFFYNSTPDDADDAIVP